jgi:hypothetical protein
MKTYGKETSGFIIGWKFPFRVTELEFVFKEGFCCMELIKDKPPSG